MLPRTMRLALLVVACACGNVAADDVDGSAPTPASARLVSETFNCDCMPEVPPDPTWGTVTIEYVAGDAPAEFDIVGVRYFFGDAGAMLDAQVTPNGSGLLVPHQDLVVEHVKPFGNGSGEAPCGNDSYTLEVDLDGPNGAQTLRSSPTPYECPE